MSNALSGNFIIWGRQMNENPIENNSLNQIQLVCRLADFKEVLFKTSLYY